MTMLFRLVQRIAAPLLRVSLGLILLWIGGLKFLDPSPVVGLLQASLPFLAHKEFVYTVGVLEITASLLLFAGIAIRYIGLLVLILFAGTLTIFAVAPAVSYGPRGFPYLSLAGQFLLKDFVLAAAAIALAAIDSTTDRSGHAAAARRAA